MSRTNKDSRVFKLQKSRQKTDSKIRDYKMKKEDLRRQLSDEDYCPKCAAYTSFANGFLLCTKCEWSTFETEELNFETLTFAQAV